QHTRSKRDWSSDVCSSDLERPINDFYIYGNHIYISTNYGISKLNIDKSEFSDTYYIGDSGDKLGVNSSSVYDDHIFAATQGGGRSEERRVGKERRKRVDMS